MKPLLAMTVLLLLAGCSNRLNQHYGFTEPEAKVADCRIRAKLAGSYTERSGQEQHVTVKGNPYELVISLQLPASPEPSIDHAVVTSLVLIEAGAEKVYDLTPMLEGDVGRLDVEQTEGYRVARLLLKLDKHALAHSAHTLSVGITLRGQEGERAHEVDLEFTPIFHEFKSNDQVDKVMSV